MPIYDGEWYDEWEKPFDGSGMAMPSSTQGKRAQRRRRAVPHTQLQIESSQAFAHAAWIWQTKLDQDQRDEWIMRGDTWDWHCRDGNRKNLPGFALFARSTITQFLYDVPQQFFLHLSAEPPWCTLTTATWNDVTEKVELLFANPVPTINYDFSSLSVYQLNPAMDCYFDVDVDPPNGTHPVPNSTHRIGHVSPWPAADPGVWSGELYWSATPGLDMYVYARWHQDYRFAGVSTIVDVPPVFGEGAMGGVIVPDVTGRYAEDGLYMGKMSYVWEEGGWWVWYHMFAHGWFLSNARGSTNDPYWWKAGDPGPDGAYLPMLSAVGIGIFVLD